MRNWFQGSFVRRLALVLPVTCLVMASLIACSSDATSQTNPPVTAPSASSKAVSSSMTYQPKPGAYNVAIADNLSLTTKNGRKMPVKVYYPQGEGPFPTIIFSHGGGGSKDYYEPLGRFWASHGYVSIHPTHSDSISIRGRDFIRELGDYALKNSAAWEERASDISVVIDSFGELARQAPSLQGKLDGQRIGVGGHSFGSYTTQLVGGATIDIPNGPKGKSFADKRVKALLLLSPQGRGQQGLTENSWKTMTLPAMFMTGTNDKIGGGQGPEWRREGFDRVPAGDKYLIFIEGANHFSFGGRIGGGNETATPQQPSQGGIRGRIRERMRERMMERRLGTKSDPNVDQEAIFEYVQVGSLAFWDAYLKSSGEGKTYLTNKSLETFSNGDASISIR